MAGRLSTAIYSSRQREKGNCEPNALRGDGITVAYGDSGGSTVANRNHQLEEAMNTEKDDDEDFWDEFFGIKEWANED